MCLAGRFPSPEQAVLVCGQVLAPHAPTQPVPLPRQGSASCFSAWLQAPDPAVGHLTQAPGGWGLRERSEAAGHLTAHPSPPGPWQPGGTHVLHTAMVWHASAVQNSETVLYCRLTWWKNVVAVENSRAA